MASDYFVKDDITYLQCKECKTFKPLNDNNWYKHNEGFMGYLGRCKDCIKNGRKSERSLEMARKVDYNRYHNNEKRKKYVCNDATKRTNKHLETNKKWRSIHTNACRLIKKKGIRPDICPIC